MYYHNSALALNLDEQSSQLLCVNATFNDRDAMIQCTEEGPLLQFGYCATYNDETKLLSITICPHYQPNGYNLSPSGQNCSSNVLWSSIDPLVFTITREQGSSLHATHENLTMSPFPRV